MTETTSSKPRTPGGRSPEYNLAKNALRGLRDDLFRDVFAYRPLPKGTYEGLLAQRLPKGMRRHLGYFPHGVVLAAAAITLAIGVMGTDPGYGTNQLGWLLAALIPAVAVALTLLRPTLAWWLSLAAAPLGVMASYGSERPWPVSSLFGHIAVLMVVAARTRPRTAAWMYALTACYSFFADAAYGGWDSDTAPMLFLAAIAVAFVVSIQINWKARHEVVRERTVSAVERDKRTLLEERTTIARELHDVVAHHMSVVAIQAEAAPYRVENPPPELEQAFVTIRENAVAALTELRRVLGVVRAEDYEAPDAPQPTLADLDRLLANVRETGLTVEKAVTGAVRELPQGVELSAYRIVQEALSNALRHAPGATARVEVGYVLGGLGLRIVNGPPTGLVKPSPGAGHGLTGMRERVTMLDGEMTTRQTEDGGYEVTVFLPVAARAEENDRTEGTA
ncbi:histidine kinase [Streptomyces sp. NPDC059009]|uniref:histidine kinase n=1 Tax=Streptomyces sp. NPDC059009 TaxID=3346694 RepID=UPI0036B9F5C7